VRLSQAGTRTALAPPLPQPYKALAARGLYFRPGQASLTVAAPGVGKSLFWLNYALRAGQPCLYLSGDTDRHDVTIRLLAATSGYENSQCEQFAGGGVAGFDPAALLRHADHIQWVFDASLPAEYIVERLAAYREMHGEYPALVVIDNLRNTIDGDDEFREMRQATVAIQKLARLTGSHVATLAHATGEYENGDKPIPQGGVAGKLSKDPEAVITLYRYGQGQLGVIVAKNRSGRPDPAAQAPIVLNIDYSRSSLYGFEETT
jgi:hypothetical protein